MKLHDSRPGDLLMWRRDEQVSLYIVLGLAHESSDVDPVVKLLVVYSRMPGLELTDNILCDAVRDHELHMSVMSSVDDVVDNLPHIL